MTDPLSKNVWKDIRTVQTTAQIDTNQGDPAMHETIRNDTDTGVLSWHWIEINSDTADL